MQKEPKQPKKKWVNPLRDRTRVVPFVVPGKEERLGALGSLAGQKWRIKKSLIAIHDEFQPMDTPKPGQNLYEFQEEGQGFGLFASKLRNEIDIEKQIIYICPFHAKISKQTIQRIKKKAKAFFFGAKVKLFDLHKPKLSQFEPMQGPNGAVYYNGVRVNEYFSKHLPKNTYSIAIVTNLLIYNGNNPIEGLEEKWVFGLGSFKDRTSVISFEQMLIKDYGGKRDENVEDESELNVEFLQRVVNHELCHTFGMRHCIYFKCLMNGSNMYEEAIAKKPYLCSICIRKLQLALNFEIVDRYQALGDEKSLMLAGKIRDAFNVKSK